MKSVAFNINCFLNKIIYIDISQFMRHYDLLYRHHNSLEIMIFNENWSNLSVVISEINSVIKACSTSVGSTVLVYKYLIYMAKFFLAKSFTTTIAKFIIWLCFFLMLENH